MAENLVIVAIPSEDDYVWKLSSEKIPHMTLLFLGETSSVSLRDLVEIQAFLGHATSISKMGPFMLDVDHRGTLGDEDADVIFFRKDWSLKRIEELRAQLLQHVPIRNAYDLTEQFPTWEPHLTMGYPSTPAKEDDRDYPGIRWVHFDRLALWYGNYQGPEFRLESKYDFDLSEVGMSTTSELGAEFLKHYGVKGMRWGVRKRRDVGTETRVDTGLVRRQTKVKAKGGESQDATEDAVKAAVQKQKFKKSGPAALSNQELRELATRLQLEEQVKQLATPKGKKFVKRQLSTSGQQQVQRGINVAVERSFDKAAR